MCLNDETKLTFVGEIDKNEKFLDALNLEVPYEWEEIQEWKNRMQEFICKSGIQLPADMDGDLFVWMDDYDIERYVNKRFRVKSRTVEKIYFYGNGTQSRES